MSVNSLVSIRPAVLERADDHFVLTAFDSALPYLASIGSGAQWGSVPFTSKPSVVKDMHDFLLRSDRIHALEEAEAQKTHDAGAVARRVFEAEGSSGRKQWNKLIVAEVSTGDQLAVRVAAIGLASHAPGYVQSSLPSEFSGSTKMKASPRSQGSGGSVTDTADDEGVEGGRPFLYVNYLISHRDPLSLANDSATASASASASSISALGKEAGEALLKDTISQARNLGVSTIFVDCWAGNGGGLVRYVPAHQAND
ncbi:unnamed protein product [Tilletia controversa]|nr:unnamed protein product [Tilletia controversa]